MAIDQEKVVAAAVKIFAKKGLLQASLAEIALASGTTESNLYRLFRSKDGLILHLYEYWWDGVFNVTQEVFNDEWITSAREKLLLMVDRVRIFVMKNPDFLKIVNNTYLTTARQEQENDLLAELKKKVWGKNQEVLTFVDKTIAAGQEKGELIGPDILEAHVIRTILMGSMRALLYGVFVVPSATEDAAASSLTRDDVQRGISFMIDAFSLKNSTPN